MQMERGIKTIHKFTPSEAAYMITKSKNNPEKEKDELCKKKKRKAKRSEGSSNLIVERKVMLDIYSLRRQITHLDDKPLFEVKTRPSVSSPYIYKPRTSIS